MDKQHCTRCRRKINIKKNLLYDCQCGAKLIAVEINKKLVISDVSKDDARKEK